MVSATWDHVGLLSAVAFVNLLSRWDDRPSVAVALSQVAGCPARGCCEKGWKTMEKRGGRIGEVGASVDSHPLRSGRTADPVVTLKVPCRRIRPPPLSRRSRLCGCTGDNVARVGRLRPQPTVVADVVVASVAPPSLSGWVGGIAHIAVEATVDA